MYLGMKKTEACFLSEKEKEQQSARLTAQTKKKPEEMI